ncbi:hypothetical protein JG688_00009355 [Phytophthora aleatoria]|uniref:Uncharacterized protein n=1 Tax=Phytophthora aleatoria TaxID=2496075 RepID=A0A8J5IGB0_9STRA|nr:hypothetical protein JG688_00009355 [Phytophthora aleatoria]
MADTSANMAMDVRRSVQPIISSQITADDFYWSPADCALHIALSREPKHTLMKSRGLLNWQGHQFAESK